jgi:hypothetical protein
MEPVTRDQLYDLVWETPMLRLGERFGVSSSYLARVCIELRVPRPERGHWSKLEFGKPSPKPELPPARPGDLTEWKPGTSLGTTERTTEQVRRARPTAIAPESGAPHLTKASRAQPSSPQDKRHALLVGVRPLFLKTRDSDTGLLRPFKKHLVDVVSSERNLEANLDAADTLFKALTAKGHRVLMAPPYSPASPMRRAPVDEREAPTRNGYHAGVWSPDRLTVVYVGDVPIGLTLFEMTESVEMVYVGGTKGSKYLPVRDLTPAQLRLYREPRYWRTNKHGASGRLALQAYSPSWSIAWVKRWQETKAGQFSSMVPGIAAEIGQAGPEIASKLEEARLKAEAAELKRQEERRREVEVAERARKIKARQDARSDLLAAIASWEQTRSVHAFFASVEHDARALEASEQEALRARLDLARELVGELDALGALKAWKAPQER